MAMSGGGGRGRMKAEINVTPLVDVVLVLLIIFMVVTPLMKRGREVALPPAGRGMAPSPNAVIVSVTRDGKVWVEQDGMADDRALAARLGAEPGKPITLKADETLTFAEVRRVMRVARGAGAKGIALSVAGRR